MILDTEPCTSWLQVQMQDNVGTENFYFFTNVHHPTLNGTLPYFRQQHSTAQRPELCLAVISIVFYSSELECSLE